MPHLEHIFDVFLGSTRTTIEPALAALYEVRVTSLFQATSPMLLARLWFCIMPFILRSSNAIRPYRLTNWLLIRWANSYRLFAIRSWTRSTTLRAFLRSGVPLGA